jgi:hypothetical protein
MNTKTIGNISEAHAIAYFLKNGYAISIPFGDSNRYDFILDNGNSLFKIQVKTGQLYDGFVRVRAYSVSSKDGKTTKNSYIDQVDYIVAYVSELDKLYILKPNDFGKSAVMALRTISPENNQQKNIKYAVDYEIEKCII